MLNVMKQEDKKSIRAQALKARERIPPEQAKAASMAVAKQLVGVIKSTNSVVAGYWSARNEVDLGEALAQLSERGHELCLPVIEAPGEALFFRRWRIGHPLELGKFGIRIPPESEPALMPGAIIVPLVAFDSAGHRLGYGAGYYDHTIRQLREHENSVQIIGAAYSMQQVERIPAEAHDEKLDAVVTEKEVLTFK